MIVEYPYIALEITRRCNMACAHCLRGDSQPEDMSSWVMRALFAKMSEGTEIDQITFTGGDPSLFVDGVWQTHKMLREKSISLGHFYFSTNGLEESLGLAEACLWMYAYSNDKDMCLVDVVSTKWHRLNAVLDWDSMILKGLSFANINITTPAEIKREGRAMELTGVAFKDMQTPGMIILGRDNNDRMFVRQGMIYVNVYGEIFSDCDLSYATQYENAKNANGYYIGSVFEKKTIDYMIGRYNQRIIDGAIGEQMGFISLPSGEYIDSNGDKVTWWGEDE